MDPERWSKLVEVERDAEMQIRRVSMDVGRPPLPVAITNRLIFKLYDRVEALEKTLASLTQAKGGGAQPALSPPPPRPPQPADKIGA